MLHALKEHVGNRLIQQGDTQYEELRKVWNGAIDKHPLAIIVCESEQDVVAAVKFANKNNLSISIRGGGHHLAGLAVCDDGLMIDLSNMRNVQVDEQRRVALVQGGATLADVDGETQKYGLATPTGTVSETGIAGLALAGGMGYLRGKYGLTSDNIVGVNIVTAEGELLHANQESNPDLFWAVRGGGGNFGVVTSFEFQLHPVGPEVLGIDVMYDFDDAKEVVVKAQEYLRHSSDDVSFNLTVMQLPPAPFLPEFLHNKKVVAVSGMYAGDAEQGLQEIQPLRELAKPIVDQTGKIPFVELQKKLDPMVQNHIPVYGTSLYFSELTEEVMDILINKIENAPTPAILVQLWALGGEMNRISPAKTPFAIRDAQFILLVDAMAMNGEEELCQKWVDSIYSGMLSYSYKKSSYLNAMEVDDEVTKSAYQENYNRLLEIKKKYDPRNLFRHNHNIK